MFQIRNLHNVPCSLKDVFKGMQAKMLKLSSNTQKQTKAALFEIGRDLKKKAVELIDKQPKTGRVYRIRIGARIVEHQASAAGEAPAIITGRLRRSIDYKVIGWNMLEFASYNTAYAKYLEYANLLTKSGQGSLKIEPRPFLSAAFAAEETRFEYRIKNALIKASQL